MKNSRGNIIIIEGPQGVGKSTMANFLRDNLSSSNLYRLTGIKDKTKTGYQKNKTMYLSLLNYMETLEETELNLWILKYAPVCCKTLLFIFFEVFAKYSVSRLLFLL